MVVISISLESSSSAEYEDVEIFRQNFVVVKSKEDEKCALFPTGPGTLQNFTSDTFEMG